jgi:hypothetical protein
MTEGISPENLDAALAHNAELSRLRGERDALAASLAKVRELAADPRMIRWCRWPGCWHSFEAMAGPEERGWRYHSHGLLLLCPEHSEAGHLPRMDWDPARPDEAPAECSCGVRELIDRSNFDALYVWWTKHVGVPTIQALGEADHG